MTIMRRLAAAALLVALAPVPVFATELEPHKALSEKPTVEPQGFIDDAGPDTRLTCWARSTISSVTSAISSRTSELRGELSARSKICQSYD